MVIFRRKMRCFIIRDELELLMFYIPFASVIGITDVSHFPAEEKWLKAMRCHFVSNGTANMILANDESNM